MEIHTANPVVFTVRLGGSDPQVWRDGRTANDVPTF